MVMTRRMLIGGMARLGGAGAVYEALAALDFLKPPPALAAGLELANDSGAGKTVAVLGAGVAGLCAAYELDRAGYDCVVLEAAHRIGGRSLTLRRGDSFKEAGDSPTQTCAFEDGLWLNAGPGRIPHHHVRVIDYCRRFGVALQPYIFASRANLVHSGLIGNGKTMQLRQVLSDLQGHVAELLDKCIGKEGLDLPVTGVDLEKLHDMLIEFGDLSKVEPPGKAATWAYQNRSGRGGYETLPGMADQTGTPLSPLALDEILRSNVWNNWIFRETSYEWQTSLLEPVGGMDNFVKAFARQSLSRDLGTIEGLIRYGARVDAIELHDDKVAILYDQRGAHTLEADYCISTIPMPIFKDLKTNLPAPFMAAAAKLKFMDAGKVGWQADRFWETRDHIYGGISWTTDTIDQIWYPSTGYLSRKGVLTGAYMYGKRAVAFNALPVAERLHVAREQGERLHEGYADLVEHGLALGWNNMEFQRGAWADESLPDYQENAKILMQPQGRLHLAGDQFTWWTGWQEGALLSAWEAVKALDAHNRATATRRG
jgi:monoamine oxidase